MPELMRLHATDAPAPPQGSQAVTENFQKRTELAPRDFVTWLPYPIAPPSEELSETAASTSWHHHFNSEAYLKDQGEIGRAIRTCRIQLARNVDHNYGPDSYHANAGRALIPGKTSTRIGLIVLCVAGAVPDKVYDARRHGFRAIKRAERQRLFASNELRIQSEFSARRTMTRFVIEQGVDHMKRDEVRKYKDSRHQDDRESVVNSTIGRLLPIVFDQTAKQYSAAVRRGFLPPIAPRSPAELARQYVFNEPERFSMFYEAFALAADRRVVA